MLKELLAEKRDAIVAGWRDAIAGTYPADSAKFLIRKQNRFANPVGHAISQESAAIYDALMEGGGPKAFAVSLDNIIRIRAVQEFTAAEAVGFVYLLKDVIRRELATQLRDDGLARELLLFESRIDRLALLAFNTYMLCREQVFRIRTGEIKKWSTQISAKSGHSSLDEKET
jgi:hypothetical protein